MAKPAVLTPVGLIDRLQLAQLHCTSQIHNPVKGVRSSRFFYLSSTLLRAVLEAGVFPVMPIDVLLQQLLPSHARMYIALQPGQLAAQCCSGVGESRTWAGKLTTTTENGIGWMRLNVT